MKTIESNRVDRAFDHIQAVSLIHQGKDPDEVTEAIELVEESFGLDEDARKQMALRIGEFVPDDQSLGRGYMFIGVLLGLAIAKENEQT